MSKKLISLLLAVMLTISMVSVAIVSVSAAGITVSLDASKITKGDERYAVYAFNDGGNAWYDPASSDGNVYTFEISSDYTKIIFCRMNGATTDNDWNNKWDQTYDLTIDGTLYTITDKETSGEWKLLGEWSTPDAPTTTAPATEESTDASEAEETTIADDTTIAEDTTAAQTTEESTTVPTGIKTVSLDASAITEGNERYAAYAYATVGGDSWYDPVSSDGNVYTFEIADNYDKVIFCRMNGETTENSWDNKWDQTYDLTFDGTLYTISGKETSGEWKLLGSWNAAETTDAPEDTTASEDTTSPVEETTNPDAAYLTVNAVSNLFGSSTTEYDESTKQVTFSYYLDSAKNIENYQFTFTFDPAVFTISSSNSSKTCLPLFPGSILNLNKADYIKGNGTNLATWEVDPSKPFFEVTLDVNDISAIAPVTTEVKLEAEVITLASVDANGDLILDSEEKLVLGSTVNNDVYNENISSSSTTVADPAAAEDTTAPETEPDTTAPETEPDTTAPETEPDTTAPETEPDTTAPETEPDTTAPETEPVETTVPATGKIVSLDASAITEGNERYAAYAYATVGGDSWYDPISSEGNVYTFEIADNFDKVIFCRMNGETTENNWNNKWDQTYDLTFDGTLYTITGKETSGEWKLLGAWNVTEPTVPEETTAPETEPDTTAPETEPDTTAPETEPDTTAPETEPDTTAPVDAPYLTVNAISNFFGSANAEYNEETNQVTVTYFMDSDKNIENFQFTLNFDPEVLSVSSTNNIIKCFPSFTGGAGCQLNLKKESYIKGNGVNLLTWAINSSTPFFQVVFDVKDLSAVAPVTTTVDFQMEYLKLASVDEDFVLDESTEEALVAASVVDTDVVKNNNVVTSTTLTESTYAPVEPTTAPETEPDTTAPETEPDTTAPETEPDTTAPETEPDTTAPETEPDTTAPETEPDTTAPETEPDTTAPETEPDTTAPETEPDTTAPETEPDTTAPETEPDTTAPVDAPYLTVNAISNFFNTAEAKYNEDTNQVTVAYFMDSDKNIENFQFTLYFDPEVLSVSSTNNIVKCLPSFSGGAGCQLNLQKESYIKGNGVNLGTWEINNSTPFFQVVFDVKDLSAIAPVTTTVDFQMEYLKLASVDEDFVLDESTEEALVAASVVNYDVVNNNNVVTSTTLTESTYVPVEPTTAPETEPDTTAPETEPDTTAPETEPDTTAPETEPDTTAPETEPDTTAPETEPDTTAPAETLNITATSNIAVADEYDAAKGETVTVNYFLDADVLITQWKLTYDPNVLKLVTTDNFMPQMATGALYNATVEGEVQGNACNLGLYNVTFDAPFVTATFEVIGTGDTVVDLNVSVLQTAQLTDDGYVDESTELYIVKNGVVDEEALATVTTAIVINGTPEEPTTAPETEPDTTAPETEPDTTAPVTEPDTTAPETEPDTTAPETEPDTTAPTDEPTTEAPTASPDATSSTDASSTTSNSTADTPTAPSNNAVQTGDASMALIILSVLIAATGVMFVLRKREMF